MVRPKILIVEDEIITGMALCRELESLGYEIAATVTSGEEAIAAVKRMPPDVILMDINIRGDLSGIETARRIRGCFTTPIVFISGYYDREVMGLAEEVKPAGYFVKPVSSNELQEVLRKILFNTHGRCPSA